MKAGEFYHRIVGRRPAWTHHTRGEVSRFTYENNSVRIVSTQFGHSFDARVWVMGASGSAVMDWHDGSGLSWRHRPCDEVLVEILLSVNSG